MSDLLELYAGRNRVWCDGSTVTVILRESGDSATEVFGSYFAGFAETHQLATNRRTWRIVVTDQAMERALRDCPSPSFLLTGV